MTETVRAFVAIELPEPVKARLRAVVDHLERAQLRGLRLVKPEGLHLTLKFLGSVPATRVDSIVDALSQVASTQPPFAVALDGVGTFPDRGAPRVLWVGIGGDLPAMRELHRRLDTTLERLGYEPEAREFNPHLTVARIRQGTPPAARAAAAEALRAAPFDSDLGFEADTLTLMRSILRPDGAEYRLLARMSLARESTGDPAR